MKASELLLLLQHAIDLHGDVDVCVPCEGYGADEDCVEVSTALIRQRGCRYIPQDAWEQGDHRMVVVVG